ncbi:MAG: Lpg1974 family pore-forming outer membrane protein [Candidatus Algichlamydia australiensis]|nr:Lpg1974 family pore-forming outer membrane protein [Chlamydiales bacterium]
MNNMLSKVFFVLAASAAASGFGAMSTNERVAQLEQKMDCVYMDVPLSMCGCEVTASTCGPRLANARPEVKAGSGCTCPGWFIAIDAIYWHPKVGGTEYAYTDNTAQVLRAPIQNAGEGLPLSGRVKDVDFDWGWGFKVGLGYNFQHDGWDVSALYTRFSEEDSESTSPGRNSSVVPLRASAGITSPAGQAPGPQGVFLFSEFAKTEFDIDYDRIDLEMGRHFFVSEKLSLRPFIGLTAAWIDLQQKIRYVGGVANGEDLGLSVNTVHVKDESDFKGLGPRFGFNTKWRLGYDFSLYGDFSMAFLYGHFDVEHKENYSLLPANRVGLDADMNRFAPNSTIGLGIAYDTYLNEDKHHIGLKFGYENHYWWNVNQMLRIDDSTFWRYERMSEDVSFHGLTFEVRLDF